MTPAARRAVRVATLAPAVAIVALTLLAYWPAYGAGFVWDDDSWVTDNPMLRDLAGLERIWTGAERMQYYPLLFTAWWVEYQLWGLHPLGYHLVNVVLHAANAVLLGLALRRLAVPGAWWVGALFAVHPVHVESVAWITELKNVLSGAFFLLSVLAFLAFQRRGLRRLFFLSLALFACAVLSKTATATLPLVLVLVLLRVEGRVGRRDLLRLLPFFALGAALALVAVLLEQGLVRVVADDFELGFGARVLVAARALFFYPWKLVVPHPLIFNYPRWDATVAGWPAWAALAGATLAGAALALLWRRGFRGTVLAVAAYVVAIAPALGFFDVYAFRYSFVADHFQYLASIGVLILIVQAGRRLAGLVGSPGLRRGAAAAAVLALAALTWSRAGAYRDAPSLWRDTLAKNPGSWIAHQNLALWLMDHNEHDAARRELDEAIRCKPHSVESWTGRGLLLSRTGRLDEAIEALDRAVELNPHYPLARLHRGEALVRSGRHEDGLRDLDLFLSANPSYAPGYAARARALVALGRLEPALADLDRALDGRPTAELYVDRAFVLGRLERFEPALADLDRALQLDPSSARAYRVRGALRLAATGDPRPACEDWKTACELGDCRSLDERCGAR